MKVCPGDGFWSVATFAETFEVIRDAETCGWVEPELPYWAMPTVRVPT
jgi:hypothetical protein